MAVTEVTGTPHIGRTESGYRLVLSLTASPASRIWLQASLLILATMIPTAIAYGLDDRLLNGVNVWIKPMKFQASVVIHLLTMAAVTTLIDQRWRIGRMMTVTAWLSAAAGMFEIVYIVGQAGRQQHSHYNIATPIEAAMYTAMGVGAVALVAASAVVGILIMRAPRPGLTIGLKWGCGLGLMLGSLATLVVAGYLAGQTAHWVGGAATDAGGLPLTGWSTSGGDLRVPHFLATHMMQGMPVVGWLAGRWTNSGRMITMAASVVWLGLVAAAFLQALNGKPLLSM